MGIILSLFAGFSTLLGFGIIYVKTVNKELIICNALAFSAGVILSVSIFDLLPSAYSIIISKYELIPSVLLICLFLFVGIITSYFIDILVPENENSFDMDLYRKGILTFFAIIMHNIPEGMVTFLTTHNNLSLGLRITTAIALHNIPEGISVSVPIYYSTGSKLKAFIYTLISGLSEVLGAIISMLFLKKVFINIFLGFLYSFTAGVMINLVFKNLIPKSIKYNLFNAIFYFTFGATLIIIVKFIY